MAKSYEELFEENCQLRLLLASVVKAGAAALAQYRTALNQIQFDIDSQLRWVVKPDEDDAPAAQLEPTEESPPR